MDSVDILRLASKYLFQLKRECPSLLDIHLVICRMKQVIEAGIVLNVHDDNEIGDEIKTKESGSKRF